MSLWVDKYRPKSLKKLDYHLDQVNRDDFPHILLYGPMGSGKKTRAFCLVSGLFGKLAKNIRIENMTFKTPSNKKIELNIVTSPFHIELNPSDAGLYDRIIVQDIIKESAQTSQLDISGAKHFKVIVIMEAERLSLDAQQALRRTMERYAGNCRIILVAESLSSIIDPVQSRCFCVRIPAPSQEDVQTVLQNVCKKEHLSLPKKLAERIYRESCGNLRRALLMLETCRHDTYPFQEEQKIEIPHWQVFIHELAEFLLKSQSSEKLMEIRSRFYELLSKCIPENVIIKELLFSLLPHYSNNAKVQAIHAAAQYEARMKKGSKSIFHLEAFAARLMLIQKSCAA